jgi:tetratricopeptide (TPR) repeat protein
LTRLRRRLAAGALLLLCASGGLASCSSDAERRARHESRAETFLAEGKVREGLIELRSALKLEPQSAALHLRIGEVLEGIGDLQEALFFYQEAMRLAPEDSKPALATARLLLFEEPERAQELIDGVIARAPDDALAYMRRSELALARARTDEALEAARTAVEKAPDEHMTHFQLGLVHRARIRERQLLRQPLEPRLFEEALAAFDRGLAVAAEDAPAGEVVRGAIERAFVFAAWDARKAETGPAFRRAVEIARERGSKVEEARALGETQKYAQDAGDEELERWALEAQIAFEPRTYAAWARLAGLSPDDDAVLKRLIETLPEDERAHVLYARILSDRGRDEEAVAHLREVEGRVGDPVPLLAARVEVLLERGELEEARALAHKLTAEHPERPQTLEASSLLAMRERRYAEAAATLRKLLERRETARAQLRLAEAEFRQRNLAPALVAVNRALELATLDEERISMLRMKARIEIASGDPEAGLLTLKRVRRLNRGIVPVDVPMLARALYATKRNESARAVLDDALGKDDVPLTAVLLYLRHEGARDPERAHAVLERAAERYPHNPSLLGYLVRGDFAAGQPERAEARLAAAVAASPDNAALYRLQARALTSSGKHEEALAAAERALELDPERSEAADLMVGLLSRLGRLDEAVERLEAQAKQGKLGLSGRILLARLHIVGGRDPRAIELLESAVAERADLPEAKNDLAFLLAKGGADLERAHRLAEEARSALPRSAEVADTMGYVYLKRGLAAAAAEQFRSALELSDERSATWATAQYHLGLSYKALGREPEARLAFERSLATAVDFPEAADARREAENLAGGAAGAS